MQTLMRDHPRKTRAFLTYSLLVLAALIVFVSRAHAQQTEDIYQNGFERFVPSYSYAWQTDQFVVAQVGRVYEFEVLVQDSSGAPITTGDVAWTIDNAAVASLTVLSPRRVRVQVNSAPGPGVVRIAAKHPDTQIVSNAQLIFETLLPRSRFVSGASLVSATATQAIFVANAETNVITAGDVVMVGDSKALLARIGSISTAGGQRVAQITPAFVDEYFALGGQTVALKSDEGAFGLNVRDGVALITDASGEVLSRELLTPQNFSCTGSGGASIVLDRTKFVFTGAGPNNFLAGLVFDWRIPKIATTGQWNGRVTVLPGAISVNGAVDAACSLDLPEVPIPSVGLTAYTASIGLTVKPSLHFELSGTVTTNLFNNIESFGEVSGPITMGVQQALGFWVPVVSQDLRAEAGVRRVGSDALSTTINSELKAYLRVEPLVGVSAAWFTALSYNYAELDLGGRLQLGLQSPFDQNRMDYQGPSGEASGLARAKLKSPVILNAMLAKLMALTSLSAIPSNFDINLFDSTPGKLPYAKGNILTSPSQVTQNCAAPTVLFSISNLRDNVALPLTPFAAGTFQLWLYRPGQPNAPVWRSPDQPFSFGLAQYSPSIDQIRDAGGNPITGTLIPQIRARYRTQLFGIPDPITALVPIVANDASSFTINPATLNCGKLNDTGQNWCANATTGNLLCPQAGFPDQDGDHGRDALARNGQLVKIGGGNAGFDYTKISNSGNVLPASAALGTGASDWACTRDNVSGLIWEVKTNNPASLRHMNHTYTWYDTNSAINGGNAGSVGTSTTCNGTLGQCNTSAFVAAVNAQGLCGFSDWRMPKPDELMGIVDYGRTTAPMIDPTYFVNTANSGNAEVWTGRNYAPDSSVAWSVTHSSGFVYESLKSSSGVGVRLVLAVQ